jgi:hypothetical protein
MTPAGVQATSCGRFCTSRPTLSAAKPSYVLPDRNRVEHLLRRARPHRLRQRRLHQDAVVLVAPVQPIHFAQHVVERGAGGDPRAVRVEPDVFGGLQLVPHVDVRRRILADEHDAEPRRPAVRFHERVNFRFDLLPHRRGERLSIQYPSRHPATLSPNVTQSQYGQIRFVIGVKAASRNRLCDRAYPK